jgi:phospholipid N-methyltransferase
MARAMTLSFLLAALRDPTAIGSVWPSSPSLARAMVELAELQRGDRVVELGAGIGPITRVLAAHDGPFLALEPEPNLAARCRAAVPGVSVVEALAQDLPELVEARGWPGVERIVSGLPFAVWADDVQDAVLSAVAEVLVPGGTFVTFTYAHSPRLPAGRRFRERLQATFGPVETSPVVWTNLPPAVVYRARVRSRTPG